MKHAATSVVGIPLSPFGSPSRSLAVSLFGRIGQLACALAIISIAVGGSRIAHATVPADTLYGGAFLRFVTVDQNDGSLTPLSDRGGFRLLALAFDSSGRLFAGGCIANSFPCRLNPDYLLMEIDPLTGEVVNIIGPVTDDSGSSVKIFALSVQPETDVLFGFSIDFSDSLPLMCTSGRSTRPPLQPLRLAQEYPRAVCPIALGMSHSVSPPTARSTTSTAGPGAPGLT